MFTEYFDLLDYGISSGIINPNDPDNEDWGAVVNDVILNTSHTALYFPFRDRDYLVQSRINISRSILLKGAGIQEPRGVVLRFKHTTFSPNVDIGINVTSKNVVIEGIYFANQFEDEGRIKTAIQVSEPRVKIENCTFFFFEQKGIHLLSGAHSWYIKDIKISGSGTAGCRHSGIHAESSMGYGLAINILALEGSGIVDESPLGNTYVGCHTNNTGNDENSENGVYVMDNGLMMGNYAEDNQEDIVVKEDAQLWNGHTGLAVKDTGTVLQPRYEQFSFAFSSGSQGMRFENHLDKPVFLTFGGKETLTLFEFVSLDDIFSQKEQSMNPDYLGYYENTLKENFNRWRLRFNDNLGVYQWYFESPDASGMIFSNLSEFENMEGRHIGFLGYYLPLNRSAIFIGASSSPNSLPSLAGLGSFIYNSNPDVFESGTPTDENYLGWLVATNANGQVEQIGVELLEN